MPGFHFHLQKAVGPCWFLVRCLDTWVFPVTSMFKAGVGRMGARVTGFSFHSQNPAGIC